MFKMKMIMILMLIVKLLELIKTHQINNISYIILGLITNRDLLILILYVHMNFLIRYIKSTSIVIDLTMNTLNITPTTFTYSKYKKIHKITNTFTKKWPKRIMLKKFIFYLHHGIQFLTLNHVSLYLGE